MKMGLPRSGTKISVDEPDNSLPVSEQDLACGQNTEL